MPATAFKVFIGKSPKKTFMDYHLKNKKPIPPPGHYPLDKLDAAWKRCSTSPNTMKMKRH